MVKILLHPVAGAAAGDHSISMLSSLIPQLPLHQLIPRLLLGLMSCSFVLCLMRSRTASRTHTACNLMVTLATIMMLISHVTTPLLLLLFIGEYICLLGLVSSHSMATACIVPLAALVQTQGFFITGHLCEFAGLNYTAGFVGYEEFDLVRSGLLVAVDSYGGMALVVLATVLVVPEELVSLHGRDRHAWSMDATKYILCGMSVLRALSCFCATLSAAIQRRHLYAWALFAPKFAFEVYFLFMTDSLLSVIAVCLGA